MGFKNNNIIRREGFKPIDLNDGNVNAIFNKCLALKGSLRKNCSSSILFPTVGGYREDSEQQIFFDTKTLVSSKKDILYLYGQLRDSHMHSKASYMSIDDAFINYLNRQWTKDNAVLLELLHLGAAESMQVLSPFIKEKNSAIFNADIIKPTLSPKDPNFPAWWEKHKSEWEDPKKDAHDGPDGH